LNLPMPRHPVYAGGMNAKERYRLRQKLQAALLRVVEVVAEMDEAGVDCKSADVLANRVAIDAAMTLLKHFLPEDEPAKAMVRQPGQASTIAVLAKMKLTRQKATQARKARSAKAKKRRDR
jgi:hypothetical protein